MVSILCDFCDWVTYPLNETKDEIEKAWKQAKEHEKECKG